MARFLVAAAVLALATGAVGSAAPPPGRTAALSDLHGAIEDERRMIEVLKRNPPRMGVFRERLYSASSKLNRVLAFAATVQLPAQVEQNVTNALQSDYDASTSLVYGSSSESVAKAIAHLEKALRLKQLAVPGIQSATAPTGTPQCSDGKDNDGDGITDWNLEPGCRSAKDVRERSPFTCSLDTTVEGGRLVLSGSCSGAFSEVEFTLLDDLQLNGRFDIQHAPSCSPPTVTRVRCSTKTAEQNPEHKVRVSFTTTTRTRGQRVRTRFFDRRKREIRSYTVPVR